jgi:DNA-binding CsgD family transcriptional regulator
MERLAGGTAEAVIEPARRSPKPLSRPYRFHAAIASCLLARYRSNMTGRQPSSVFVAAESFGPAKAPLAAIEHCAALLISAAGAGSHGAAGSGPDSLTDRERDVALLARRGYTAKEIGERLFIGRRTVESHLQTIYSKVGVKSKRDLVRYLDDVGFR